MPLTSLIYFMVGAGVLALVTFSLAFTYGKEGYEDESGFNFVRPPEVTGQQRDLTLPGMGRDQSRAVSGRINQ